MSYTSKFNLGDKVSFQFNDVKHTGTITAVIFEAHSRTSYIVAFFATEWKTIQILESEIKICKLPIHHVNVVFKVAAKDVNSARSLIEDMVDTYICDVSEIEDFEDLGCAYITDGCAYITDFTIKE